MLIQKLLPEIPAIARKFCALGFELSPVGLSALLYEFSTERVEAMYELPYASLRIGIQESPESRSCYSFFLAQYIASSHETSCVLFNRRCGGLLLKANDPVLLRRMCRYL